MEDMEELLPTAAAASPGEAEMKEIPSATAATGQLQHEQWEPYYHLLLPILTQSMLLWSVHPLL
jgi:hypothetical protein